MYHVLPSEMHLPPWFFATPRFYGLGKSRTPPPDTELQEHSDLPVSIRVIDLVKRFRHFPFINLPSDTIAVRGLTLKIHRGQIFALLGISMFHIISSNSFFF